MSLTVVSPSEWGMGPYSGHARSAKTVRRAVVHHSASPAPADHALCDDAVRGFDRFHRQTRGWAAIGYHRVICSHGTVYAARGISTVGAHADNANADTIGYCLIAAGDNRATPAQLAALAAIGARDARELGHDLAVTIHKKASPPGHTTCPGAGITGQVADLRVFRARVVIDPHPTWGTVVDRIDAGRVMVYVTDQGDTLRRLLKANGMSADSFHELNPGWDLGHIDQDAPMRGGQYVHLT